jgi:glycosyltransferase involved in cell wall biosynthesis
MTGVGSANAQIEIVTTTSRGTSPISLFLMINSFETGGSERQFTVLAQNIGSPKFHLHLGCVNRRGPLADQLGDVPQFPLGGSLFGWKSLRTRLNLSHHLRSRHVQVAHAFDFYANLTLIPAARFARVPIVIGSHRQLGDLLTPAQFRAQTVAFRWCDAVACNSQAAAGRLAAAGVPREKLAVIGNALPAAAFETAPAALPQRPGGLRVGMVARMNAHYKNHAGFLRVAAQIHRRMPNVEFLLVGDGPLRSEFEQQAASLGLGDRAIFLGDRRDIPNVLASMDVAVLTSDSESLSNAILEAMAARLPVVAYNVGGNAELVNNERGALVAPKNEDEFADAIHRLLSDASLRGRQGANAARFVEEKFSLDSVRRRYENLYLTLLEKKSRKTFTAMTGAANPPRSKLKVAIVAPSLRYVGGQAVQADLLMRHWQTDPDVEVSFLAVDPPLPAPLDWAGSIPGLRTILRQPIYFWHLWRGLAKVDVAHIFSASYWSFLLAPAPAWFFARLRGKRSIINYRSGEARDHLRRFRTALPVLKRVDLLVVPSGYLVDVFREFGLTAKVVPNIVDMSQFSFRPRKPLRPHLVCTRGFHRYYSVDVVVRAFAEVQRSFPEARLDLVGSGPLEAEIRALVKELGIPGVNFAGVATRQQIGKFYDDADIFINASRLDNMPVSILEAFAAGTPVVSTAPEGMRYLVGHERTGLLSEIGDPTALARNVIRLLTDADLASRLAHNALEESRRYSWEAVRQQWLEVYYSLASSTW